MDNKIIVVKIRDKTSNSSYKYMPGKITKYSNVLLNKKALP